MLSRTSEYALRAVLFLSRAPDGGPQPAESVATALGVPRNYLSKVLHRLARRGVLDSVRGPGGGFKLARAADRIVVSDIVSEFDERGSLAGCVLSERACNEMSPCEAHARWAEWSGEMKRLLDGTTVADFVGPPRDGGGNGRPGSVRDVERRVR